MSVVLGLLSVAVMPAAIIVADRRAELELLDAAFAIPIALALALAALSAGRRAAQQAQLSVRGRGSAARVGRGLGLLGLFLTGSAIVSVLVYAFLSYRGGG